MKVLVTILAVACAIQCVQHANARKTSAVQLLNGLVNYDRHELPPTSPAGEPVKVLVTMYILDILKVDDINQEITIQMYFRQKWNDSRLQFNYGEKRSTIELELTDLERIWRPDLFFVTENRGRINDIVLPNSFVKWNNTGQLFFSTRITMTTRCPMDLTYFPHDTQKCYLEIESYKYNAHQVKLEWDGNMSAAISDSVQERNFENVDMNYDAESVTFTSGVYRRLNVALTFKRRVHFYVVKLYVPYVILTILSFLSLWIKPRYVNLRLILLLSILLIMFFLAMDTKDYIPAMPYTKAIDVWMGVNMALVFGLLLESIFAAQSLRNELNQQNGGLKEDVEASEGVKEKSAESKFSALNARFFNSSKVGKIEYRRIDELSRFFFPAVFGFFNLIYWSVNAS